MKGAAAEDRALAYLQSRGLTLVLRNFRAKGGEIDLVMRDGASLVLVEVRQRSSARYGSAAETVDARKQARIVLAARWLIAQRPELARLPARFDVLALDAGDGIDWIRGAFDAGG